MAMSKTGKNNDNSNNNDCSACLYRVERVAQRLAHLVALLVEDEAMGQHRLVGRVAVRSHRRQQARLKPPSVLVRPWHVVVSFGQSQKQRQLNKQSATGVGEIAENISLPLCVNHAAAYE